MMMSSANLAIPVNSSSPVQNLLVYNAGDFRVGEGANLGDPISVFDDIVPGDTYALEDGARRRRLALQMRLEGGLTIAEDTETGLPGAELHIDCAILLMSPDGGTTEALVLVEVDEDSDIAAIFLLPLGRLRPRAGYQVVNLDRTGARQKFARMACVSFTRGTHITLATGQQVKIEELKAGDRVLTRDDGPQEVRWIGQHTVRAEGDFAPIVITAGTLNNTSDLVISPDHRLFVYQRSDEIGAGRPELLVKARHLVNGDTVHVQDGGFVEYFQLLFDRHHIIYAEGIAAESMLVDPRTRPALPAELLEKLAAILPQHGGRDLKGLDVQKALLDRPDAIDLLRRASMQ